MFDWFLNYCRQVIFSYHISTFSCIVPIAVVLIGWTSGRWPTVTSQEAQSLRPSGYLALQRPSSPPNFLSTDGDMISRPSRGLCWVRGSYICWVIFWYVPSVWLAAWQQTHRHISIYVQVYNDTADSIVFLYQFFYDLEEEEEEYLFDGQLQLLKEL